MENILDFSKTLLKQHINENSITADFTCGNGNDTVFLGMNSKRVYAFDLQKEATDCTKSLLEKNNISNVTVINDGHENLDKYINEEIDAGIFNLGYLPTGDRSITTNFATTKLAVTKALDKLKVGGVLVIVVYQGHKQGYAESEELLEFAKKLHSGKYTVLQYNFINKKLPPYIIAIMRQK
ncbi:MAG: class I SAM-dependent methyltransferase [Oscillospiraceae bacterium]